MQCKCFKEYWDQTRKNISALIAELHAGLINAYLKTGNEVLAQKEAEQVLQYMQINPQFEGAEEPLRIYLAVFQVLDKQKTCAVMSFCKTRNNYLDGGPKLRFEEARRMYVENVPWRRDLYKLINKD